MLENTDHWSIVNAHLDFIIGGKKSENFQLTVDEI